MNLNLYFIENFSYVVLLSSPIAKYNLYSLFKNNLALYKVNKSEIKNTNKLPYIIEQIVVQMFMPNSILKNYLDQLNK